jgi:hypothetical protein
VLGHARHPLGDHGSCALAGEQQKGRAPQSFCVRAGSVEKSGVEQGAGRRRAFIARDGCVLDMVVGA